MVESFFPTSLLEALELCTRKELCPLSGGTDLMVRYHSPAGILPHFKRNLLFTKNIAALNILEKDEQNLIVGANVTLSQLLNWQYTPPILQLALQEMASPAIRNVGTMAGNICNASPAGDTLPPLYALDAVVCLQSVRQTREMPIAQFVLGPGKTAIRKQELLVKIKIPCKTSNLYFYKKVAMRKAAAISKVSLAMTAAKEGKHLLSVAVAIGAVGPTVVRLPEAEQWLLHADNKPNTKLLSAVYREYDKAIQPIDDMRSTAEYRKQVTMNLLRHVYEICIK
jgi:xanthine dehydrogenase FAD-binding subunit